MLKICSYSYNKSEQINNICMYFNIQMYTIYAVTTVIRACRLVIYYYVYCKILMDHKYAVFTAKRMSKLIIYTTKVYVFLNTNTIKTLLSRTGKFINTNVHKI